MALIDKVKLSLREDGTALDDDIMDTIDACKSDLELSGVLESKITESDPLVVRAIKLYCKSEYSSDETESTRYRNNYESLKIHMCLSSDYTTETDGDVV